MVTVTSTVPQPAGLTAVICMSLINVILLAGVEPNETLVSPVKLIPVIMTLVPPVAGPFIGLIFDTVGLIPGVGVEITVSTTFTEAFPPFEVKLIIAECRPGVKVVVSTFTPMTCGSPPAAIFPLLVSSVSHVAFPVSAIQLRSI